MIRLKPLPPDDKSDRDQQDKNREDQDALASSKSNAMKQAGKSGPQACQELAEVLKKAAMMDDKAFRAYASGLATTAMATGHYPKVPLTV